MAINVYNSLNKNRIPLQNQSNFLFLTPPPVMQLRRQFKLSVVVFFFVTFRILSLMHAYLVLLITMIPCLRFGYTGCASVPC